MSRILALSAALALLAPGLARADDCSRDDTNLTLTARASQQAGHWRIDVTLALTGSAPFDPGRYAAFIDIRAAGASVARIPVGTIPLIEVYTAQLPVDDHVNRVEVEFSMDAASRTDGQAFNHDCNPADNRASIRLQ